VYIVTHVFVITGLRSSHANNELVRNMSIQSLLITYCRVVN